MRNLPEQDFKTIFRAWDVDLLGDISATGRISAALAFIVGYCLGSDVDAGECRIIHSVPPVNLLDLGRQATASPWVAGNIR